MQLYDEEFNKIPLVSQNNIKTRVSFNKTARQTDKLHCLYPVFDHIWQSLRLSLSDTDRRIGGLSRRISHGRLSACLWICRIETRFYVTHRRIHRSKITGDKEDVFKKIGGLVHFRIGGLEFRKIKRIYRICTEKKCFVIYISYRTVGILKRVFIDTVNWY